MGALSPSSQALTEPGCTRGEPFAWYPQRKAPIVSQSFKRFSATRSIETVSLANGDKFTVENTGCISYDIVLRYEFRGIAPAANDYRAWQRKGAAILRSLARLNKVGVFDLLKAADALERIQPSNIQPQEPQPVPGDGIDFMQARVLLSHKGATKTGGFVQIELYREL
ncbi:MAG: hypothetical protein ACAI44_12125 [Candidatus Sericytochromatia bacterium]